MSWLDDILNYSGPEVQDEDEDYLNERIRRASDVYLPAALSTLGESVSAPFEYAKNAVDALMRKSAKNLFGVPVPEDLTTGKAIAESLIPSESEEENVYSSAFKAMPGGALLKEPHIAAAARGLARPLAELATDPSLLLFPEGRIPALLAGGYFGTKGAEAGGEQIGRGISAFESGEPMRGIEEVGGGLGSLGTAGLALYGGAKGGLRRRGEELPIGEELPVKEKFEEELPVEGLAAAGPEPERAMIKSLRKAEGRGLISPEQRVAIERAENIAKGAFDRIKERASRILDEPEIRDLDVEANIDPSIVAEFRGKRTLEVGRKREGRIVFDPIEIAKRSRTPEEFADYFIDLLIHHEPTHTRALHRFPKEGLEGKYTLPLLEGKEAEVPGRLARHTFETERERGAITPEESRIVVGEDILRHDPEIQAVAHELRRNIVANPEIFEQLKALPDTSHGLIAARSRIEELGLLGPERERPKTAKDIIRRADELVKTEGKGAKEAIRIAKSEAEGKVDLTDYKSVTDDLIKSGLMTPEELEVLNMPLPGAGKGSMKKYLGELETGERKLPPFEIPKEEPFELPVGKGGIEPPELPVKAEGKAEEPGVYRVRLSNDEVVKVRAKSEEDALGRINKQLESMDTEVKATEALRMKTQLERAVEAEPTFEERAKRIERETGRIEAGGLKEEEIFGKQVSREKGKIETRLLREAERKEPFEVELSNGKKVVITAKSMDRAKSYVEERLKSKGQEGVTVKNIRPRPSPLERALEEPGKPELPARGRAAITPEDTFTEAWQKLYPGEKASEILAVMKATASGGDLGHMLRQGKTMLVDLATSRPGEVLEATKEMARSTISEGEFKAFHKRLEDDPIIGRAVKEFGLDLPGVAGRLKEEAFHAGVAEKIPVFGKYFIAPSERAYTSWLNSLRASEFQKWVDIGKKEGKTMDKNPEYFKGVARAVNVISQRGDFKKIGPMLNNLSNFLWAPRAKLSRYQLLQEVTGLSSSNPITKSIARRNLAKVAVFNAGLVGILKATYPGEVEFITDPERTDFLKIRKGNVTVDPWMGLGPVVRAGTRLYLGGKAKSPYTGKEYRMTPGQIAGREVLSGVAPGIALLYELSVGEDLQGYVKDREKALLNITPLAYRQIGEIVTEEGFKGLPFMALGYAGESVDVFNYEKTKEEQARIKAERGLPVSKKKKSGYSFAY